MNGEQNGAVRPFLVAAQAKALELLFSSIITSIFKFPKLILIPRDALLYVT